MTKNQGVYEALFLMLHAFQSTQQETGIEARSSRPVCQKAYR
jgi:hypothetical protein